MFAMTGQPHTISRMDQKKIPLPLALGILGALLLGGLTFILLYLAPWQKNNVSRTVTPSPHAPRVAGGASANPTQAAQAVLAAREADLEEGVHRLDEQTLLFKSGDAYLKVRTQDNQDAFSFGFYSLSDLAWEHGYLSQGVRRIVSQPDFARELSVTAAQVDQLDKLPAAPPTKWSDEQRQPVIAAYAKWKSAAGGERDRQTKHVLDQLKATANQKKSADDTAMTARVTAIRAILTEAQLQQINPLPRWEVKEN